MELVGQQVSAKDKFATWAVEGSLDADSQDLQYEPLKFRWRRHGSAGNVFN